MDDLIISDALANIKEEIQTLKEELFILLDERDHLKYFVCPKLLVKYISEIGEYECRVEKQDLKILKLKHRIEIVQAALNRECNTRTD